MMEINSAKHFQEEISSWLSLSILSLEYAKKIVADVQVSEREKKLSEFFTVALH